MPCTVLAFDTSTEQMAVALHAHGVEHGVLEPGGAQASQRLLPCIHALLARAGLTLQSVDAIAFGHGPGAFTGLRTSCAVAQGLGLGLGLPLLALDSLLVVAEDARAQLAPGARDFDVAVAMDARMDEAYAARYRWQAGAWHRRAAPALWPVAALAADWAADPPAAAAGSALGAFGARLVLAPATPQAPAEHGRAGALLRLALAAHARGEHLAADDALPLYVRDKVAQTSAERAAARAATLAP